MPAVPNVPGVPALASYLVGATAPLFLRSDLLTLINGLIPPQWGIFLDGVPVVDADTVVSFEFKQEWEIMNYPLEQGAFESYNKVQIPFDVRVRYATGGSESDRQNLLTSIEAIASSLDLFDVVTPEQVYNSCNVTHYDYRRTNSQGVGMIVVDVYLKQVSVQTTTEFTNTAQPSGNNPQTGGNQQAFPPTQGQQSQIQGANIGTGNGT